MSLVNEYDYLQRVHLECLFRDNNDVPTNTTVALKIRDSDGTVTTPTPTNPDTGVYVHEFNPNKEGTWHYRFEGSGVVTAADEGKFVVRDSAFYPGEP